MTLRLVMLVVGSSVALGAAPLLAQGRPLQPPKPPAPSQVGTAPAPATPANSQPSHERRYEPRNEYSRSRGAYRQLTRLPSQVGADGRVYTNGGSGLVPVTSQCSSRETGVWQTPAPAYSQPQITQPVPQPILQPVPGAGQQPSGVTGPAVAACWTRAASGNVEVYGYR